MPLFLFFFEWFLSEKISCAALFSFPFNGRKTNLPTHYAVCKKDTGNVSHTNATQNLISQFLDNISNKKVKIIKIDNIRFDPSHIVGEMHQVQKLCKIEKSGRSENSEDQKDIGRYLSSKRQTL